MKRLLIYFFAFVSITVASCKGSDKTGADKADSGQTHVGNESPADSNKFSTTPNETGGKDTSGNGIVAPADTIKPAP